MMNRPHLENYYDKALTCLPPIYISREEQYIKALEQYCDELEKEVANLKELIAEMEQEQVERADLELEHMYGEDW